MITIPIALILAVVLSGITRRCGCSKRLAAGVGLIPSSAAFLFFLIRQDIEIGPHGGILPAWTVAGVALALSAVASTVTVCLIHPR